MLIVADHVLKLVDKGDWQIILDLGNRVCAAQGGRRVRNDRVEDLGAVEEPPEERIYVSPEKVSANVAGRVARSEEHTSELQSRQYLVCRLLLEKKKNNN